MFFPSSWNDCQIQFYYSGLLREQHIKSPHRYETDDFCAREGDVIVDCGAAEGIWALSSVEKSKKIYLFECEEQWINALKKTFDPWKEKVEIINKFVSDTSSGNNVTLDDVFEGEDVNFIKADIEGSEVSMMRGAEKTLAARQNLRLALCVYHRRNDARDLNDILIRHGFSTALSHGYMLFIYDSYPVEAPYMRRGIIRAEKRLS
jgi:hypothetical protein